MQRVAVGRVGKPHGVKGWVSIAPSTDEPQRRFAPGAAVYLDEVPGRIAESRLTGPRVTLRLQGCDEREQAEALRGRWIYVDVDPTERPVDPDEFYDHQMIGLQVRAAGDVIGTVAEILHLPAQDVLAVNLSSGKQVLIPFVEQIVPSVDLDAGWLEVAEVEGLLDDAH